MLREYSTPADRLALSVRLPRVLGVRSTLARRVGSQTGCHPSACVYVVPARMPIRPAPVAVVTPVSISAPTVKDAVGLISCVRAIGIGPMANAVGHLRFGNGMPRAERI